MIHAGSLLLTRLTLGVTTTSTIPATSWSITAWTFAAASFTWWAVSALRTFTRWTVATLTAWAVTAALGTVRTGAPWLTCRAVVRSLVGVQCGGVIGSLGEAVRRTVLHVCMLCLGMRFGLSLFALANVQHFLQA